MTVRAGVTPGPDPPPQSVTGERRLDTRHSVVCQHRCVVRWAAGWDGTVSVGVESGQRAVRLGEIEQVGVVEHLREPFLAGRVEAVATTRGAGPFADRDRESTVAHAVSPPAA